MLGLSTHTVVLLGVSLAFYVGLAKAALVFYERLRRDADLAADRKQLFDRTYLAGTCIYLVGFIGLILLFIVVDDPVTTPVGTLDHTQLLYTGITAIIVGGLTAGSALTGILATHPDYQS